MRAVISISSNPSVTRHLEETIQTIRRDRSLDKGGNTRRVSVVANVIKSPLKRNLIQDEKFKEELSKRTSENNPILKVRKLLPVYEEKNRILDGIESNRVVVIVGGNGCGKTTQIPQYILDDFIDKGRGSLCKIICCQPRRIGAMKIAERVAKERGESWKQQASVGYLVRFECNPPREKGSILYCTSGVIANMIREDPNLSSYSHVIIDEIHERKLDVDFVITLMKNILKQNTELRLILMSATINPTSFSQYFDNCPVIEIPGQNFPVEKFFMEDIMELTGYQPQQDHNRRSKKSQTVPEDFLRKYSESYSHKVIERLRYFDEDKLDLRLIVDVLRFICKNEKPGAILVVLPGLSEICALENMLHSDKMFRGPRNKVIPLHSSFPMHRQKLAFASFRNGPRKIIISTNITETSITIHDVVYVIDCGKRKFRNYDVDRRTESIDQTWISKSSAQQRRGRCGRTQPGKCYHLFTSYRESLLDDYDKPEIIQSPLETITLKIIFMQLGDVHEFYSKAVSVPDPRAVDLSLYLLQTMDCLDDAGKLTTLGQAVAQLPLDPHLGKVLLLGAVFSCISPILTIVSCLDLNHKGYCCLIKNSDNSLSDHLAYADGFKERLLSRGMYLEGGSEVEISYTIMAIRKLRCSYSKMLYRFGLIRRNPFHSDCNRNSKHSELIKAILSVGFYPNFAVTDSDPDGGRFYSLGQRVHLHRSSIVSTRNASSVDFLFFYEKLKLSKVYLFDVSAVRGNSLFLMGPNLQEVIVNGKTVTKIDNWVEVRSPDNSLAVLKQVRQTLMGIVYRVIKDRKVVKWDSRNAETEFLRAIVASTSKEYVCCETELYLTEINKRQWQATHS